MSLLRASVPAALRRGQGREFEKDGGKGLGRQAGGCRREERQGRTGKLLADGFASLAQAGGKSAIPAAVRHFLSADLVFANRRQQRSQVNAVSAPHGERRTWPNPWARPPRQPRPGAFCRIPHGRERQRQGRGPQ